MSAIYKRLLCVLSELFLITCLLGQDVKPVPIGGDLPELEFTMLNRNSNNDIQKSFFDKVQGSTKDFKGKATILCFWASWWYENFDDFRKLNSLLNSEQRQLNIIPITHDNDFESLLYLNKKFPDWGNNIVLPTVVNDRTFEQLFPHTELPYCVWINSQGKVIGFTDLEKVTDQNVQRFINGESDFLTIKKSTEILDVPVFSMMTVLRKNNPSRTPFDTIPVFNDLIYKVSIFTKYRKNLLSSYDQNSYPLSILASNLTIESLYKIALNDEGGKVIWNTNNKNILALSDSAFQKIESSYERMKWNLKNRFCYQVQMPPLPPVPTGTSRQPLSAFFKKFEIMLKDLNESFGELYNLKGEIVVRNGVKTIVISELIGKK